MAVPGGLAMPSKSPHIIQTALGRVKLWAQPGEHRRRTRSSGALLADMIALKKTLLFCAACEAKMGRHWATRHRTEERRVGKEWRTRWAPDHEKTEKEVSR